MKKINILFLFLLLSIVSFAQISLSPFENEKQNGYKGQNIAELTYVEDSFSFIVLGDFGRVGDYYQKDVAREMVHATIALDAEFIISVGDNFYPIGIQSTQDYQWTSSFESTYKDPGVYTDWYVALGNHDYRGNVQAQIDYSNISRRWNMPDRYYSKIFALDNGDKLLM